MKTLIVILAICTLGYVVDHWRALTDRNSASATENPHELITYWTKSCPTCVQLEGELNKRHIPHERRDLDKEDAARELTDKRARVGKASLHLTLPVAEIDGVLYEGVTIDKIVKRLK